MTKILLIDDMEAVRQALTAVLKMAGHEVVAAPDGIAAKELMRQHNFNLVITDIMMPNMDGFEVITFIQTLPVRPRILAISGGGTSLPADQTLLLAQTKADAVLSKPFDNAKFLNIIHQLLT